MNENRKAKKNKTETAADFIKVLIAAVCLCGMLWYAVFCVNDLFLHDRIGIYLPNVIVPAIFIITAAFILYRIIRFIVNRTESAFERNMWFIISAVIIGILTYRMFYPLFLIAAAPLNAELTMTKIIFYAEKGDREKIYEMYSDYSKGIPRLSKNIPGEIDDIINAFSEGITKDERKNLAYNSDWGGERGGGSFAIRKYSILICFKNPIETPSGQKYEVSIGLHIIDKDDTNNVGISSVHK